MINVTLRTESGGFIATVEIPPFIKMPTVLVWGSRFFLHNHEDHTYRECFSYWIPPSDNDDRLAR